MKITTRRQAIALSKRRYFTGKPCKRGHIAERHTTNGACVTCSAENSAKWDEANPGIRSANQAVRLREKTVTPRASLTRTIDRLRKPKPPPSARQNAIEQRLIRYKMTKPCKAGHLGERYTTGVCVECAQAYPKAHPEAWKLTQTAGRARYAARKRGNGGKITAAEISTLMEQQRGRCAACNQRMKQPELDHVIPLSRGGSSDKTNLQLLCMSCNRSKAAKDPIEWAQQRGRLL